MSPVQLHRDYDPEEFTYDRISDVWVATNGPGSAGRYFFIAHLTSQPYAGGGHWMAFLRYPDLGQEVYIDRPFNANQGYREPGQANNAIFERAYKQLGWRIERIDVDKIPRDVDDGLEDIVE